MCNYIYNMIYDTYIGSLLYSSRSIRRNRKDCERGSVEFSGRGPARRDRLAGGPAPGERLGHSQATSTAKRREDHVR